MSELMISAVELKERLKEELAAIDCKASANSWKYCIERSSRQ